MFMLRIPKPYTKVFSPPTSFGEFMKIIFKTRGYENKKIHANTNKNWKYFEKWKIV